jgi:hypothetical protein
VSGASSRADGQPASVTPPHGRGNATTSTHDAADLTVPATTNAAFTYTLNRACASSPSATPRSASRAA